MKNSITIFLVDDDPLYSKMLEAYLLKSFPFSIRIFLSGEECLKYMTEEPEIIFLDYFLNSKDAGSKNGLQILKQIREMNMETKVVMLSGQDDMEVAISCMRNGAFDYIIKGETAFMQVKKTVLHFYHLKDLNKYKTISYVSIGAIAAVIGVAAILHIF